MVDSDMFQRSLSDMIYLIISFCNKDIRPKKKGKTDQPSIWNNQSSTRFIRIYLRWNATSDSTSEAAVLWKKVFLKFLQISQENTCVEIQHRLQHRCFPV